MKTRFINHVKLLLVILIAYETSAIAEPSNFGNPNVVPPQAEYRGLTYGEWLAEWFKWTNSLPLDHHPLTDTAPCSEGQTGKVWFIDGTLNSPFPDIGRDCTIKPGTALFIMLVGSSWDNEGCSSDAPPIVQRTNLSETELRANAANDLVGLYGTNRKVIIDGVEVKGLPAEGACDVTHPETCQSPFRVQTPVFDYTIPALNNTLIIFDGACYNDPNNNGQPYKVNGAVGDGFGILVKPMSKGSHVLQFGRLNANGVPNRIYHIKVSEQENEEVKGGNNFH